MLCRLFGDLNRVWQCYVGPLVKPCLAMLGRPFGDLIRVWLGRFGDLSRARLCHVGPLVTLFVFGYVV